MNGFSQEALDRASYELQRHFGREGSIYGIKACEEIARIALTAYGTVPEVVPTGWRLVPEKATVLMLEVLAGPSAVGRVSFSHYHQWEKQWQEQWERLLAECPATPSEREHYMNSCKE